MPLETAVVMCNGRGAIPKTTAVVGTPCLRAAHLCQGEYADAEIIGNLAFIGYSESKLRVEFTRSLICTCALHQLAPTLKHFCRTGQDRTVLA